MLTPVRRGSLKNKEKDKASSLTAALRISGPTNYRNNSVTGAAGRVRPLSSRP
jgi:hypothetical protein